MQLRPYEAHRCRGPPAISALLGRNRLFCHEDAFSFFSPTILKAPEDLVDGATGKKLVVDWLGVRVERDLYCHTSYYRQRVAHAIRAEICDLEAWLAIRPAGAFPQPLPLPLVAEEYFEYVDVLDSVLAYARRRGGVESHDHELWRNRPYRFVELGAGFGLWTLTAHAALQQLAATGHLAGGAGGAAARSAPGGGSRFEAICLEADPAKLKDLRRTLARNRVDNVTVLGGAIAREGGEQQVALGGKAGFYAVHVMDDTLRQHYESSGHRLNYASTLSVRSILRPLVGRRGRRDAGLVDMLDVDVQGQEHHLFDEGTMSLLDRQVLRVHIGTHGDASHPGTKPQLTGEQNASATEYDFERTLDVREREIARRFVAHGWRPRWTFGMNAGLCDLPELFRATPLGYACMADGVLGFVNPRLEGQ